MAKRLKNNNGMALLKRNNNNNNGILQNFLYHRYLPSPVCQRKE